MTENETPWELQDVPDDLSEIPSPGFAFVGALAAVAIVVACIFVLFI